METPQGMDKLATPVRAKKVRHVNQRSKLKVSIEQRHG
jgi:hypothetical protein